jgi:hypothetical protein
LDSWTKNSDDGIKYFSGTATYSKTLQASAAWFRPGTSLQLDLGIVKDLAEVSLNGSLVGIAWKPPYRVDLGSLLTPGENHLEIKVTNEWTNRIIGDRIVPSEKRILAGSAAGGPGAPAGARGAGQPGRGPGGFGGPQTPAEAGLIGPVAILIETGR